VEFILSIAEGVLAITANGSRRELSEFFEKLPFRAVTSSHQKITPFMVLFELGMW
jgi:hypothetical protein